MRAKLLFVAFCWWRGCFTLFAGLFWQKSPDQRSYAESYRTEEEGPVSLTVCESRAASARVDDTWRHAAGIDSRYLFTIKVKRSSSVKSSHPLAHQSPIMHDALTKDAELGCWMLVYPLIIRARVWYNKKAVADALVQVKISTDSNNFAERYRAVLWCERTHTISD